MRLFNKKQDRIFIISNSLWSIHNFRSELINSLKKKKYKVTIFSFGGKQEKNNKTLEGEIIPLNKFSYIFFFSIMRLFFLFLIYRPKYVLTFTHIPIILCSFFSIIFRFKQINNLAWGGADSLSKFYQLLLIFLLKVSFKVSFMTFFQNHDDFKLFVSRYKSSKSSNIKVLPGSGVPRYLYKKRNLNNLFEYNHINILNVSRLIPTKGLINFCEAAKIIKSKYKINVNFFIQSSFKPDTTFNKYEKLIFDYHFKKFIKILPFKKNINTLYYDMDIAVCTSLREGVPRFLIEASSCGLPIIASNVPGCREICIDNYNGFLFNYGDTFDLVNKILKLIKLNNFHFLKFKKNSYKQFSHKFEINYVINSYLKMIK